MYAGRALPQEIRDEGLSAAYSLMGRHVAALICELAPQVERWRLHRDQAVFGRMDPLDRKLAQVQTTLERPSDEDDEVFADLRRSLAQEEAMVEHLAGLRPDRLASGRRGSIFVHPALALQKGLQREPSGTGEDALDAFLARRGRHVVGGAPGAGRSTWLAWLQRASLLRPGGRLAVRVLLRKQDLEVLPRRSGLIRAHLGSHLVRDATDARIRKWARANRLAFLIRR